MDVRDVALAMSRMAEVGRRGRRYIVGGNPVTLKELADHIHTVSGVPVPSMILPRPVGMTYARLSEALARLRNTEVLSSVTGIRAIYEGKYRRLSSERAVTELAISFRPLQETISDSIHWFVEHGYVKPNGAVVG